MEIPSYLNRPEVTYAAIIRSAEASSKNNSRVADKPHTSTLGSLPKILDKNFVIGFFLPALLAVVAVAWAFPRLGVLAPVRSLSASDKSVGDLIYLVLLVFVMAIFLMTANDTQYRMLEGYL